MGAIRSDKGDGQPRVRAVERAFEILDALAAAPGPLTLTDLARVAGLHPTTAFRMLETMKSRNLVRHGSDGWELGAHLFELGSSFVRGVSIWSHGNELVEQLASETNETASMGILEEGEVLYIAIAHGNRELGIQSQAGTRHPSHATALGKVLLASLPWSDVEKILERRPPIRMTAKTITGLAEIRAELEKVSSLGYAVDDEERVAGVCCISAPIRDRTGSTVAALSVSGPAFRIHETGTKTLAESVILRANSASEMLGGAPAPRTLVGGAS